MRRAVSYVVPGMRWDERPTDDETQRPKLKTGRPLLRQTDETDSYPSKTLLRSLRRTLTIAQFGDLRSLENSQIHVSATSLFRLRLCQAKVKSAGLIIAAPARWRYLRED